MSKLYDIIIYIYDQTRRFKNESEEEIIYQIIRSLLVENGTFHLPNQDQLSDDFHQERFGGKQSPRQQLFQTKQQKELLKEKERIEVQQKRLRESEERAKVVLGLAKIEKQKKAVTLLKELSYDFPVLTQLDWDKETALETANRVVSDKTNHEYLKEDPDHMIFIISEKQSYNKVRYKAAGYTLDQVLSNPDKNVAFECEKNWRGGYTTKKDGNGQIVPLTSKPKAYVRIIFSNKVNEVYYVPAEELLGAIGTSERVFLLDRPRNIELSFSYGVALGRDGGDHCQPGTLKTVYKLNVFSSMNGGGLLDLFKL